MRGTKRLGARQVVWFECPATGQIYHSAAKPGGARGRSQPGKRYCHLCNKCFSANNFSHQHLSNLHRPERVESLRALQRSDGTIELEWSAAESNGLSLTHYSVSCSADGGETWHECMDATGQRAYVPAHLIRNDVLYMFSVAGVNLAGKGPYSEASEPVGGVGNQPTPVFTKYVTAGIQPPSPLSGATGFEQTSAGPSVLSPVDVGYESGGTEDTAGVRSPFDQCRLGELRLDFSEALGPPTSPAPCETVPRNLPGLSPQDCSVTSTATEPSSSTRQTNIQASSGFSQGGGQLFAQPGVHVSCDGSVAEQIDDLPQAAPLAIATVTSPTLDLPEEECDSEGVLESQPEDSTIAPPQRRPSASAAAASYRRKRARRGFCGSSQASSAGAALGSEDAGAPGASAMDVSPQRSTVHLDGLSAVPTSLIARAVLSPGHEKVGFGLAHPITDTGMKVEYDEGCGADGSPIPVQVASPLKSSWAVDKAVVPPSPNLHFARACPTDVELGFWLTEIQQCTDGADYVGEASPRVATPHLTTAEKNNTVDSVDGQLVTYTNMCAKAAAEDRAKMGEEDLVPSMTRAGPTRNVSGGTQSSYRLSSSSTGVESRGTNGTARLGRLNAPRALTVSTGPKAPCDNVVSSPTLSPSHISSPTLSVSPYLASPSIHQSVPPTGIRAAMSWDPALMQEAAALMPTDDLEALLASSQTSSLARVEGAHAHVTCAGSTAVEHAKPVAMQSTPLAALVNQHEKHVSLQFAPRAASHRGPRHVKAGETGGGVGSKHSHADPREAIPSNVSVGTKVSSVKGWMRRWAWGGSTTVSEDRGPWLSDAVGTQAKTQGVNAASSDVPACDSEDTRGFSYTHPQGRVEQLPLDPCPPSAPPSAPASFDTTQEVGHRPAHLNLVEKAGASLAVWLRAMSSTGSPDGTRGDVGLNRAQTDAKQCGERGVYKDAPSMAKRSMAQSSKLAERNRASSSDSASIAVLRAAKASSTRKEKITLEAVHTSQPTCDHFGKLYPCGSEVAAVQTSIIAGQTYHTVRVKLSATPTSTECALLTPMLIQQLAREGIPTEEHLLSDALAAGADAESIAATTESPCYIAERIRINRNPLVAPAVMHCDGWRGASENATDALDKEEKLSPSNHTSLGAHATASCEGGQENLVGFDGDLFPTSTATRENLDRPAARTRFGGAGDGVVGITSAPFAESAACDEFVVKVPLDSTSSPLHRSVTHSSTEQAAPKLRGIVSSASLTTHDRKMALSAQPSFTMSNDGRATMSVDSLTLRTSCPRPRHSCGGFNLPMPCRVQSCP